MTMELDTISTAGVDAKALGAVDQANLIAITSEQEYKGAAEILKGFKAIQREIDDTFDPVIKANHEAHRQALEAKKKHSEPLKAAEVIVKKKLGTYSAEQEKIRREKEAKLREELRQKEEEERLAEAEKADEAGQDDKVEEILSRPAPAPVVVLPSETPKVAGISTRKTWKFRIVDEKDIPREYLKVDEVKIGQMVRALKENAKIDGVEVYAVDSIAARGF